MIYNWRSKTIYEIGRTSNHIYLRPHRLLRPYIAHYTVWTVSAVELPHSAESLILVPDASGCAVLHLSETNVAGTMWGPTTHAVTVSDGTDGISVRVFIEFLPGGLFQFTGINQSGLTDRIFSLWDVMPATFLALCHLLETAHQVEEVVEGLDAILLPLLLAREIPAAASSAAASLKRANGLLTMESLSMQECYSTRHLNRVLCEYLGMGPKQFARLLRINAAIRLIDSGVSLTYLAQESGFYDQAHFIRDFKEVCGITPGVYRDRMSDFYNEPLKF